MPISRQDAYLKELDWFAIDNAGELATFVGGCGEIPAIVLQQCTLTDSPMEHIDRLTAVMPEIGGHRVEGTDRAPARNEDCSAIEDCTYTTGNAGPTMA